MAWGPKYRIVAIAALFLDSSRAETAIIIANNGIEHGFLNRQNNGPGGLNTVSVDAGVGDSGSGANEN